MSKYRILEKKGEYKRFDCPYLYKCEKYADLSKLTPLAKEATFQFIEPTYSWKHNDMCTETYVPKFIVQEYEYISFDFPAKEIWKDLKEFTSLEEAREYKLELELEEGIVRE